MGMLYLICAGGCSVEALKFLLLGKKKQLVNRIHEAIKESLPVIDVDGSFLYRKYQSLSSSGCTVAVPVPSSPPLSGWITVSEQSMRGVMSSIPLVTSGLVYTYLAGHVGHFGDQGAFRALMRGYTHWASGRLQEMEVNTKHPSYCHVRCTMTPSMRAGVYKVYLLLGQDGKLATICSATCECSAGLSASCTHVSAVLQALTSINSVPFNLTNPNVHPTSDPDATEVPVTSLPCKWKAPKKRKQSTMRMSEAVFEKHDYNKPMKRKIKPLEDFDPRPPEFRGKANMLLPDLLEKVKGEQLCVSLLLDPSYRHWDDAPPTTPMQPSSHNIPDSIALQATISAFKESLKVTEYDIQCIEKNTREQRHSPLWHSARRYRITASLFGAVLSRKEKTPPDNLVLRILQPKNFTSAATSYGIAMEPVAVRAYITYQESNGHSNIAVTPCGFHISSTSPFLGASPDGAIYDPSTVAQPFGFLEIKCPYSARDLTPANACALTGFCCALDTANGQLKLKKNHHYFVQVQGQMAIGGRPWCDFVVFTGQGVSVERIFYDEQFWNETLLPKLTSFYDNCVVPEIVSPVHSLGVPIRDLEK